MLSMRGLISKVLKCRNNARPFEEKKRGKGTAMKSGAGTRLDVRYIAQG